VTMALSPLEAYLATLELHPLRTKVFTAGAFAIMGDFLAQQISARRNIKPTTVAGRHGQERKTGWVDLSVWDRKRTMTFALFGCLYTGFFQHTWFRLLNELGNALPHVSAMWVAVLKLGLNQFCMIPGVYFPLFYLVRGRMLRGDSLQQVLQSAKQEYWRNLRLNWTLWVPVQFLMFSTVSEKFQVPFCCMVALLWNTILSFVGMRRKKEERPGAETLAEAGSIVKLLVNPNLVFLKPSPIGESYGPKPLTPIKPADRSPLAPGSRRGKRA